MRKKVMFYEDEEGNRPAEEFLINGLDEKTRAKVESMLRYLGRHWQLMRRPYVDYIEKELYELRVQFGRNRVRVIYAYMFKDYIILLHGFLKRTEKITEEDKYIARKRMEDFQERFDKGLVTLTEIGG